MENILNELRSLKLPTHYYGCGNPPVCRDIRNDNRESEPCISTEEDFNAFVLSNPKNRVSRSYLNVIQEKILTTDHNIVMTHGDFTPRNIVVQSATNDSVDIVGLIDWEASGAYPDYWEYTKMLNTVSTSKEDDWLQYLPRVECKDSAGDWAKQLLIDRISE